MRQILALSLLALFALAVHANSENEIEYGAYRKLLTERAACWLYPPAKADLKLNAYKGKAGFAFKNKGLKGGISKTIPKVATLKACFQACVTAKVCQTFSYTTSTKTCSLSNYGVPLYGFEEGAKYQGWCNNVKGKISGWVGAP